MTTIATDGKTIAADGLRVWNGEIVQRDCSKLRVAGSAIYGFSGSAPLLHPIVEAHQRGSLLKEHLPWHADPDWTMIVITAAGLRKYSYVTLEPEWFPYPFAIGAGAEYAVGAMWAGATPRQAIELIAARTNHTGGEIQVIDIASALGLMQQAAE